jgi:creatinine amidohydrolase
MGHACEFETSMILALRPELVRKEEIKNDYREEDPALRGLYVMEDFSQRTQRGAVGYPEFATAEKGRRCLQAAIDRTAEVVEGLLRRPLPK